VFFEVLVKEFPKPPHGVHFVLAVKEDGLFPAVRGRLELPVNPIPEPREERVRPPRAQLFCRVVIAAQKGRDLVSDVVPRYIPRRPRISCNKGTT
jgi:hypothetical protein